MTDLERNYFNSFVRVRDFGTANDNVIRDFAAAVANFAAVAAGIDAIEASGGVQSSGAIGQGVVEKDFTLANIRTWMRRMNRTSRAMAVDDPAVAELFRMPHGNNEQQWVSAARAFVTNATPIQQQFIDYGMPADFLARLQAEIEAYEQAVTQKNTAFDERVGATANIGATVKETLKAVRRLRGIVPNIFTGNAAKLAEWKSASHVEQLPKKQNDDEDNGGNNPPNP